MPATAASTALVLAGAKAIAEQAVRTVSEAIKGKLASKLKIWEADKVLRKLTERAKDISQVKTLLCLESPQLLTDFYSPQTLIVPSERHIEAQLHNLKDYSRLLITGVAGQGKSILFRYFALEALAQKQLPLFIELRNYKHAPSINQLITGELSILGFPADDFIVEHLLKNTVVTVFLDAFDEIPEEYQQKARKEIEDLARKSHKTRVMVSSRPSLEIESSPFFTVARLAPLISETAIFALRKMCEAKDDPVAITKELSDTRFSKVIGLLTTPLMVALLLLHFRLSRELPSTRLAFFNDLFEVLFKRHDQTKGYKRFRRSLASESDLRDIFCFLSFVTRSIDAVEADITSFVGHIERSNKFFGRGIDSSGALDDIIHGTNLLLQEGSSCRFAHKSIQEFYAAKFLSTQAEKDIARFFEARNTNWTLWRQFFEFFELLNSVMFYKHFVIPHVGLLVFDDASQRISHDWKPAIGVYRKLFGELAVGIHEDKPGLSLLRNREQHYYLPCFEKGNFNEILPLEFELITVIPPCDLINLGIPTVKPHNLSEILATGKMRESELRVYSCDDILSHPISGPIIMEGLRPRILEAFAPIHKYYELVDHRENESDLFS